MSARRVCSGTRPSRYHSMRAISAPPRRPDTLIRMPLAPRRIADCIERFMARRKATRRSSCWAMFSATSWLSTSGLRTSTMFRNTSPSAITERSLRSLSMSAPFLPMITPGRAALLVRTLDDDPRHAGLAKALLQLLADGDVLVEQTAVVVARREPAAVPGAVDGEPQPDRIDFLTHQAASPSSRTTIVISEKGFSMREDRPRARAEKRFMIRFLPT